MTECDLEIAHQIEQAYICDVKVSQLDQLVFDTEFVDEKNVKQLRHRFNEEGCRRLDPLTWIPARVTQAELRDIIPSELPQSLKYENIHDVTLQQGWKIRCFQGKHRVTAAMEWLEDHGDERWWVLTLYDPSKLGPNACIRLQKQECGSRQFCDGEIYRNVRHYQTQGNSQAAGEWLARWSVTKCRDFKQIYHSKANRHREFRENLENLLPFKGLWTSWLMGAHLLSLQCPEVRCTYPLCF